MFQETSGQLFSTLELTFSIDFSAKEDKTSVELIKGGRDIEANAANVYTYVKKYSHCKYEFLLICSYYLIDTEAPLRIEGKLSLGLF